jgi:glycosyltransferase involved in cell wall biosynthesis
MKLLFALPGFHRYERGAEVALLAVAGELAALGEEVTVAGSGAPRPGTPYRYLRIPSLRREQLERLPTFPPFRSETAWEDATFAAGLALRGGLGGYDATVTCSFPFSHWALRRAGRAGPAHVFVTQNGDWPAYSQDAEYRLFGCDGLVCTNPAYLARNRDRWRCALIPNGVDRERFGHGVPRRAELGLPGKGPVVLMVSALIETKRVLDGIRAVAQLDEATLVVAGDGPMRREVNALAERLLPGRFKLLALGAGEMPDLYKSADVFLHLSTLESFGNVFLEAWASGLPIVAHASEPARWILGDGHFLCDTTDERALQGALRAALAAPRSPATAPGLERFAWPAIARQYRAFISGIVEARQAARPRK